MDGESSKSVMITAVAEPKEISVSGAGSCEVTVLLVGSGGYTVGADVPEQDPVT